MDAVVLAGAKNEGSLGEISRERFEAGIRVGGSTLLDYVIRPLHSVAEIERIVVVGPEECLSPDSLKMTWKVVPFGETMVDNLHRGMDALAPKGMVLILTADIPLITADAIEDFLRHSREHPAQVYYPIVRQEPLERKYPGVKRTYATLREGTFTGGNIVLLAPEIIELHVGAIEQAVLLRKKPVQMAKLLGFRYLFRLLFGNLSITEIEERIERKLHFKGKAIETSYAEIGIDVDKPSDLELVRHILEHNQETG